MTSITTLEIDPTDYAGGIAVWAAMAPVFDTTGSPPESGIHVHAREYPGKRKAIDQTFDQVRVKTRHAGQSEYVEIDGPLARLFNVADILVEPPQAIRCPNCSTLVNDTGWAAVLPRQMRKCAVCECIFESSKPIIANAIAELRQMLNVGHDMKQPVKSTKRWHHSLVDWPSGVQVWGSNAAILWTAERSEEAGVHVHAYNNTIIGKPRLADETFGDVAIDGSQLDEKQIRFQWRS